MQAPHYGLFWEIIRKQFPRTRTLAALNSSIEVPPNREVSLTVEEAPLPRVWFISKDDSSLVQLQPDRLLFNWRAGENRLKYPRFKAVIRDFESILGKLRHFVADNELGELSLVQSELSYVNHIRRGMGWSSLGDIGEIFPDFSWRRGSRIVSEPESFNFRSNHNYPGGMLHVAVLTARHNTDKADQIIRFDLNVRGNATSFDEAALWDWFTDANSYIVEAFVDLTSKNAQREIWKRKS